MLIQLDIPDDEVARKVLGMYRSGRLSELHLTFHSRRVVGVSVKDVLMTPDSGTVGTMAGLPFPGTPVTLASGGMVMR